MEGYNTFHCEIGISQTIKTCSVELSQDLALEISQIASISHNTSQPVILSLEHNERTIFLSWSGKGTKHSKKVVFINRNFAHLLDLKEHDLVQLHLHTFVSTYNSIIIEPLKEKEWEYLNLNSSFLENDLLNQIQVVYPGLIFPVQVKGNAVVNVLVRDVSPSACCGFLGQHTEVHIALPTQNHQMQEKAVLTDSVDPSSETNLYEKRTKDLKKEYYKMNLEEDSQRNIKHLMDIYKSEKENSYSLTTLLKKFCTSEVTETTKVEPVMGITSLYDLKESPDMSATNSVMLRVQPYCDIPYSLKNSPTTFCTCFVPKKVYDRLIPTFKKVGPEKPLNLLRLKTIYSDEELEWCKENKDIVVNLKSTREGEYYNNPFIALPKELMHFLGLSNGSIVELCSLNAQPSPIFGIILSNRDALISEGKKREGNVQVDEKSLFLNLLNAFKLEFGDEEFILNEVTPLVYMDGNRQICFNLKCLKKETSSFQHPWYTLCTAEYLLQIPIDNEREINKTATMDLQNVEKKQPRGFEFKSSRKQLGLGRDKHDAAVNYFLRTTLLSQKYSSYSGSGAVLICSSSLSTSPGCGRSSLCHAICDTLSRSPYYFYTNIIDCIPLRGKKLDTIQEIWRKVILDAQWHHPSVIFFDDLDFLLESVNTVEQGGSQSLHYTKLAQAFADLLKENFSRKTSVCILISSRTLGSLHSLIAHSPLHLIHLTLELSLPTEEERKDIIEGCIKRKPCVVIKESAVSKLVMQTDGFVAGDLSLVLKRAENFQFQRKKFRPKTEHEVTQLSEEDIESAMTGFVPISLHGLNLTKRVDKSFSDIGGLHKVKQILTETFIWPIMYSNTFSSTSMRLTSGILLYGAPGTGKTMLAGALAKESGLNLVHIKGPELLSKYIGSSEQNVRDLFSKAKAAAPSLLFFDEFDALAPRRGHDSTGVTDRVVNQMLTELDGVEALVGVYVLAATSRPDLIDPALLRPGRLDKSVYCPIPDKDERMEILLALGKDLNICNDNLRDLCIATDGYSGADMKALLFNAQLEAFHRVLALNRSGSNPHSNEQQQKKSYEIEITSEDLKLSLSKTQPSVSIKERRKYEKRFREFGGITDPSRKTVDFQNQRATLA